MPALLLELPTNSLEEGLRDAIFFSDTERLLRRVLEPIMAPGLSIQIRFEESGRAMAKGTAYILPCLLQLGVQSESLDRGINKWIVVTSCKYLFDIPIKLDIE